MVLQVLSLPVRVDVGLAHSMAPGQGPATPMRHPVWLGLQGGLHNGRDLFDGIGGLASASGSDLPQTVQSLFSKSLAPQHGHFPIDRKLPGNG